MARLRQSLLVSRSNWWFGGMLLVLHAALAWGIDSLVARAMLIVHFGVFLMWQPLWRGERSIETRHAFVIIVVGIMLTGWSNWWLMAVWLALLFGLTTLVSESKTARTIIMFPILIATAKQFGWDIIGFCLPMAYLINQVYVFYFNSKPANISYLTDMYSTGDGFRFGIIQLILIIALLVPWTHYVMPLMGFKSQLW